MRASMSLSPEFIHNLNKSERLQLLDFVHSSLTTIEVKCSNTSNSVIRKDYEAFLKKLKGISLTMSFSPDMPVYVKDNAIRSYGIRLLKKEIEWGEKHDVKCMVLHAPLRVYHPLADIKESKDYLQDIKMIMPLSFLTKTPVYIENSLDWAFGSVEQLKHLADGISFNIGNFVFSHGDSCLIMDYLSKEIRHINHIKLSDTSEMHDNAHTPIGAGILPVASYINALHSLRYEGIIIDECDGVLSDKIKSCTQLINFINQTL